MSNQNSLPRNVGPINNDTQVAEFKRQHRCQLLPYLMSILEDGFKTIKNYGCTDHQRDLVTLKRRYESQGLGFIQVTLPALFSGLMGYLENGVSYYPEFKIQKGTSHPRFLRKLFVMIYDHETEKQDKARVIQVIYQLCAAFSKLEGPYPTAVLRKELADFVDVDRSLLGCAFNAPDIRFITQHATTIISQLFKDYKGFDGHELPSPGSGATNTKVEKDLRYRPEFLYNQLNDAYDHDIWFNTTYQYIFGGTAVDYAANLLSEKQYAEYPTSRFKFINKKLGKPRGICIEENETQFFQQGLRKMLYHWIENHPKTAGKINFTNQSINRELALRSSSNRTMATIDMSSASDRIDRELVLSLFKHTDLFEKLEAVSTKMMQLPTGLGQNPTLKTQKFAPMGSGVCFPIMGLVHWALITAIIYNSTMPESHRLAAEVYVYGDDIIVPSSCAALVYKILPRYGMKINMEKSYVTSHFRESCGCHAIYGYDITPAFFKKVTLTTSRSSNSELLVSLISKEQRLRENRFYVTADYVRKQVHQLFGVMPEVHEASCILGWKTKDPVSKQQLMPYCHGVRSANEDPQQRLYKFRVVVSTESVLPPLQDDRGYFRKQVMLTRDSRDVKGDPEDLRVFWSWIPEPALSCDLSNFSSHLTRHTTEYVPSGRVRQMLNFRRGVITMTM